MKMMADSLSGSLFSYLLVLCRPIFQTLIRINPTDYFLCSSWKAEPSWKNHIITLISSIISLWASSSAGPLSLLSNPFTYVAHQLPVPCPMVAVTFLLQLSSQAPNSTSPALFFAEGLTFCFLGKTDGLRHVSSQFPFPPSNSVICSLFYSSSMRDSQRRLATHLCS